MRAGIGGSALGFPMIWLRRSKPVIWSGLFDIVPPCWIGIDRYGRHFSSLSIYMGEGGSCDCRVWTGKEFYTDSLLCEKIILIWKNLYRLLLQREAKKNNLKLRSGMDPDWCCRGWSLDRFRFLFLVKQVTPFLEKTKLNKSSSCLWENRPCVDSGITENGAIYLSGKSKK